MKLKSSFDVELTTVQNMSEWSVADSSNDNEQEEQPTPATPGM